MAWHLTDDRSSPATLLASARRGDRAALNGLIREHQQAVYTLARQMVRDGILAEDISQEVFIRLYRNLAALERPERVRAWLLRVTANLCIDFFRRHKGPDPVDLDADGATGQLPDPAPLPYDQVAAHERRQAVERSMEALSPLPRAIITLYYFEGLDCPAIGDILQMPVNTVKSHLRRGRERLRAELEEMREGGST